jgi:hypothetical protein
MTWRIQSRDKGGETFKFDQPDAKRAIEDLEDQLAMGREAWIEDAAGQRSAEIPIKLTVTVESWAMIAVAAAANNQSVEDWIANQLEAAAKTEWGRVKDKEADRKQVEARQEKAGQDFLNQHYRGLGGTGT